MTTPTTVEMAREIAAHLTHPRNVIGNELRSLSDQVMALTKERDEYKTLAHGWVAENAPGGWIDTLRKERDALAANHKDCVKCLGEALQDRANLAAAAKLAVAALDDWYYGANQDRPKATVFAALQALKKAGVQ